VVLLLLTSAACAPPPVVRSSLPSSAQAFQSFALEPAVFESNDPNPGLFCLVGTKNCGASSEFGRCLLSTGRCKSDAHVEFASADSRLLLESSAAARIRKPSYPRNGEAISRDRSGLVDLSYLQKRDIVCGNGLESVHD
jgi:hypothetical protein